MADLTSGTIKQSTFDIETGRDSRDIKAAFWALYDALKALWDATGSTAKTNLVSNAVNEFTNWSPAQSTAKENALMVLGVVNILALGALYITKFKR